MAVPPGILQGIADRPRGRVAIVTGAGTSVEPPTSLPLADAVALEAHRKLVRDGLLDQHSCRDPRDLAAVADAVERAGYPPDILIERIDRQGLINAQPNAGHLAAAALLLEGVVAGVYTLNFDLALTHALSALGARDRVTVVTGPGTYRDLGTICLVYLHGTANSDATAWILTTRQLEEEWRDRWQELVAGRLMATPIVVFAGLGTPASLLAHTANKIRDSAAGTVYQVDPAPYENSAFAVALGIPEERYVRAGWGEFMATISAALLQEQINELDGAIREVIRDEQLDNEMLANSTHLARTLSGFSLAEFGLLRGCWLLHDGFIPWDLIRSRWLAQLMLVVAGVARHLASEPKLRSDGLVEFWRGRELVFMCALAHAQAQWSWSAVDALLRNLRTGASPGLRTAKVVLALGLDSGPASPAPPEDIVSEDQYDIVSAQTPMHLKDGWTYAMHPGRLAELLEIYNA